MKLARVREARGRISLLPRWMHRVYAFAAGYFWLPCPLCARQMGGHEWRRVEGKDASIPAGRAGVSHGICPACTYEGKGGGHPARPVFDPLPRPLSDHCRPGRCMALMCCSYECSQGRCPSIPAEFREPTP